MISTKLSTSLHATGFSITRLPESEKVTIIVFRILIAAHITSHQCNDGPCIVQKITWPLGFTTCLASAVKSSALSLSKCPPRCLQHQCICNALHAGQQQGHAPPLFFKLLSIVEIPEISSVASSKISSDLCFQEYT